MIINQPLVACKKQRFLEVRWDGRKNGSYPLPTPTVWLFLGQTGLEPIFELNLLATGIQTHLIKEAMPMVMRI